MFRGETFYDTAIRKIKDETGNPTAQVHAIGVVDVWNTFFPDSNWDMPEYSGTQTVNIVVVCRLDGDNDDIRYNPEAGGQWAVDAHRWISVRECMEVNMYDKYVRLNVEKALQLDYIIN